MTLRQLGHAIGRFFEKVDTWIGNTLDTILDYDLEEILPVLGTIVFWAVVIWIYIKVKKVTQDRKRE